ncbi:hypothetical protein ACEWY4_002172 [Coilia grayii]|uniref:Ig-like domain-containing protein n=1 Tax=Coilia grayii TaxID=363190 RepID=A0ABD1KV18_9TELE
MSCVYSHPTGLVVQDAYWTKDNHDYTLGITEDPNYKGRVYVQCGDSTRKCTLHITNVQYTDSGDYFCVIKSNLEDNAWTSTFGVKLIVTGLRLVVPETVKEGVDVSFTCSTSCPLSGSPLFIWKKNGRPVEGKKMNGNQLHLHPVRREDEGSYSCAVRGYENYATLPEKINVMYPAKDTWVDKHPPVETLAEVL